MTGLVALEARQVRAVKVDCVGPEATATSQRDVGAMFSAMRGDASGQRVRMPIDLFCWVLSFLRTRRTKRPRMR